MREQTALLDHVSNSPAKRTDRIGCNRFAVELDRAGVGLKQTNDQSKQGRFPAATWPNENSGLAAFDGEISRMQGGRLRVALAHIGEFNKGAHCVGDAGTPACMFLIRKYASAQTGLSASRCGY